MSGYISNVCILHAGGEQELHFIAYLENALKSLHGSAFLLEYTKYQDRQSKEVIMYNDAVRYKKEKTPMIVLISKCLFELMWVTPHKQGLLNVITNYSTKNCLHIWLDVNESDCKSRSLSLCRNDGHFRRTNAADSAKLSPQQVVAKIEEELSENGDGKFISQNNYSVDNEIEEMHRNWERALLGLSPTAPTGTTNTTQKVPHLPPPVPQQIPQTRSRPKKNDPYKNALRMANMTPEEIEAAGMLDAHPTTEQSNTSSKKKNKKKKGKKKGEETTIMLLKDLTDKDRREICSYLDKGSGANWKQLAETFSISPTLIRKSSETSNNASLTEQLIDHLGKIKPELEVSEFGIKCKQIMRNDVQIYISDNILN